MRASSGRVSILSLPSDQTEELLPILVDDVIITLTTLWIEHRLRSDRPGVLLGNDVSSSRRDSSQELTVQAVSRYDIEDVYKNSPVDVDVAD